MVAGVQQSLQGAAGDPHSFGGVFVIKIIHVTQAHGFQLIASEIRDSGRRKPPGFIEEIP
jgi:hypothetical protein